MSKSKLIIVAAVVLAITGFFILDLGQYLTLDYFKSQQAAIDRYVGEHPLLSVGIYFVIYVVVTALSLPGAAIMTLVGGAIFGLLWGTIVVSRFQDAMASINAGIRRDGPLYLFMLRLVPAFPFFVINLVMALTSLRTLTFFVVSQIGMLPGTIVYVNAGTQIAQIKTASGILSPELLGAFVLLGVFPLIARRIVDWIKNRRALKGWTKPSSFDRNLVVIGGGSGGLVCAYIAAAVKAKVTLVEKNKMGGDCLNTGCVPSKSLIRSAKFLHHIERHRDYGVRSAAADFDFADIMERVRGIVRQIEPHDSVERFEQLGVDVRQGRARI
ncbi:MAG: pyridine nucleotide-disulfide oxidoreductase, partial [Proteobacteria bacterium SW_6_67_9]